MANVLNIGIVIHQNGDWLGPDLVDKADDALSAHEDGQYPTVIVSCGAVFEGLIGKLLARLGKSAPENPGLGTLIGCLRKTGEAPSELLERLDSLNRIRNLPPHHHPEPWLTAVTEGDALQALHILLATVRWAQDRYFPPEGEEAVSSLMPVFLSVGTPHRLAQQQFLQRLRSEFRGLGVGLRQLTNSDFSEDRPFDQIREIMQGCMGALVVGLERSHAYTVFEREKSEREKLEMDRYIPTAWNQIEGAIASAMRLPVLVLCQRDIHREGIFEAENHRHRIRVFDIRTEAKGISPDLGKFLAGWVRDIEKRSGHASRPGEPGRKEASPRPRP